MILKGCALTVAPEEAGLSVDRLLIRHLPEMKRSTIRLLIDAGRLKVNDHSLSSPRLLLQAGDRVEIVKQDEQQEPEPQLLLDDPSVAVVSKPAGLRLPPGLFQGSSSSRFHQRSSSRIVLNLPDAASGVIVAVRHPRAWRKLAAQYSGGGGGRRFTVLVDRPTFRATGMLEGAPSWSFKLLKKFRECALIRLFPPCTLGADPLIALSHAGLKVVSLSGSRTPKLALHAAGVFFDHPRSGRKLSFDPPLPLSFERLVASLEPVRTLPADLPRTPPHGAWKTQGRDPQAALRSPREILKRGLQDNSDV